MSTNKTKTTPESKTRTPLQTKLNSVAGGTGRIYRAIVCGTLSTTMVLSSLPTLAVAKGRGASHGTGAAALTQVLKQSDGAGVTAAEAQSALSAYATDFDNTDIALPADVQATREGLVGGDRQLVSMSAADAWDKAGTAVDYTTKTLSYVSPTAKRVGEYGSTVFNIIKGGFTGNFGDVFDNGVELLKLLGVIEGEEVETGVTNEELQKDIEQLNTLMHDMKGITNKTLQEVYQDRLSTFDNLVGALGQDSARLEAMFQRAGAIAQEKGLYDEMDKADAAKLELPPMPEKAALPAKPEKPAEPQLPEEPEKPAELQLPEESAASVDAELSVEHQQVVDQYNADYEAWQAECDKLNAEYEAAVADYERALAEYEEAAKKAEDDYNKALLDWNNECAKIADSNYEQKNVRDKDRLATLVKICKDGEAAGDSDFASFKTIMERLDTNFGTVTIECAKDKISNPINAWDSYWNLHFNFDTQGYYMRAAYRANITYQLKRAFAVLAAYYNLANYDTTVKGSNPHGTRIDDIKKALKGIEAIPVGNSPEDVKKSCVNKDIEAARQLKKKVHCNTLGIDIDNPEMGWAISKQPGYTDEQIKDFVDRLHGRTVREDLELAGLSEDVWKLPQTKETASGESPFFGPENAKGIVLSTNSTIDDMMAGGRKGEMKAKVLLWDGTVKELTCRAYHGRGSWDRGIKNWFLDLGGNCER